MVSGTKVSKPFLVGRPNNNDDNDDDNDDDDDDDDDDVQIRLTREVMTPSSASGTARA